MFVLSLILLVLCAVSFFMAAEMAPGVREGRRASQAALLVAVGFFIACVPLLVKHPPPEGFARIVGVSAAGIAALACLWFVKTHVDYQRPAAATIAALLGLTMSALAFVVLFAEAPEPAAIAAASDPASQFSKQFDMLNERKRALENRLLSAIPDMRRKLRDDVDKVRRDMDKATAGTRVRLEAELTDIARLMLALEEEERQTQDLIVRIDGEQRQLQRAIDSKKAFGEDQTLARNLDQIWTDTSAQLDKPLTERLGSGTLEETRVREKVAELLK